MLGGRLSAVALAYDDTSLLSAARDGSFYLSVRLLCIIGVLLGRGGAVQALWLGLTARLAHGMPSARGSTT